MDCLKSKTAVSAIPVLYCSQLVCKQRFEDMAWLKTDRTRKLPTGKKTAKKMIKKLLSLKHFNKYRDNRCFRRRCERGSCFAGSLAKQSLSEADAAKTTIITVFIKMLQSQNCRRQPRFVLEPARVWQPR